MNSRNEFFSDVSAESGVAIKGDDVTRLSESGLVPDD